MREVTGGEAIGELIASSIERFEFFEFALLNAVVDVDGDTAAGRLYMWELRQDAATHRWSNAYGLYQDRYARVDGRWVFAERRYASLARSAPDGEGMVVFPVPDADIRRLRFRSGRRGCRTARRARRRPGRCRRCTGPWR